MNVWNRLNVATRQPASEIVTVRQVRSADGTGITVDRRRAGPAVVLVDGALCFRAFGPAAGLAPLLAHDLTVYTDDRRGRGESGNTTPYAVEREIEDLEMVIDLAMADAAGTGAAGTGAGGNAPTVGVYGMSSGAVLALEALRNGVAGIGRIALWEPPLSMADDASAVRPKLDELIAAGRGGEAVELFQTSIGVPEDTRVGMRQMPFWPALEAVAPTILYDLAISGGASADRYRSIIVPALVIDTATHDRLHGDAVAVAQAPPNAQYRTVATVGVGRPVAAELLSVLSEFFAG
jgi:hypothetical protein